MTGWKQPQQLLALTYLLSQGAEYDIVVNIDGFNELALPFSENMPGGVYPFYPRLWSLYTSRFLVPDNILLQFSKLVRLKQKAQQRKQFFSSPVLRSSNFCLFLFEALDRNTESQIAAVNKDLQALSNARLNTRSFENSGPRPPKFADEDKFFSTMADYWAKCSRQMDALCKANGILYLHLLQPNQYVPDSKNFTRAEKQIAYFTGEDYGYKISVERGYPALLANGRSLQQDGISFVDLTMLFKDVAEPIYEDKCCHVNKRGNDMVAEKVVEKISLRPR